jgi:hypothetical protein
LWRAVCSWLSYTVGRLVVRRHALAWLAALLMIGGGTWIMTGGGGVPQSFPWARSSAQNFGQEDAKAFEIMMKEQVWAEGYSPLINEIHRPYYEGNYWAIFRGTVENGTHVDDTGKPITVLCLHLYAQRVQYDGVGRLTPHPYFMGFLVWPEVLAKCDLDQRKQKYRFNFRSEEPPFKRRLSRCPRVI